MLIAISGSQGSGKSTIIQKLKANGYNTIDRKTSRSILTDWGHTLQEVNNDSDLTIRFQQEITNRKIDDELSAIQSDQLWFTERTHADLFTYALVSLGKDNNFNDWLEEYYVDCMKHNQAYSGVYYLRAGHFVVVGDGTRGANMHYSRMVDLTMLDITKQMVHNNKLTIIETPDLQQRMNIIQLQNQQ